MARNGSGVVGSRHIHASLGTALLTVVLRPGQAHPFKDFKVHWAEDKKFEETQRRNNWCLPPSTWQHGLGYSSFQKCLKGRNISVVVMDDHRPHYLAYDDTTHRIQGGFLVDIFEEVSRRTGLNWHTTLAVVAEPDSSKNESWDEWLGWAVSNYDMVLGDFAATPVRSKQGYRFAFPFLDVSPVLVAQIKMEEQPWYFGVMTWTRPFSWTLWLFVICAFFVGGFAYSVLEPSHCIIYKDPKAKEHSAFGHSLWLSIASFTAGEKFKPHTTFGKIYVLTWTFSLMLLRAAYTANLAKLLVIDGQAASEITGIQDAIDRNLPVCVWEGGAYDEFMRQRFPDLVVKYPSADIWSYDLVRNGYCVAMVKDRHLFKMDEGNKTINGKCDLGVVGGRLTQTYGTFVSRVDNSKCTDLLMDVINSAMHGMYNDGWFHERIERFYDDVSDQSCEKLASLHRNDKYKGGLQVQRFGGVFTLHAVVTLVLVAWVGLRWLRPQQKEQPATMIPMTLA